ncbi:helix-turn-helix transcriptional regulator [Pseudonocardiaceae bacterium YIM PH 21723]|nr:helix-turn-helix transcriptional regulator [Pseudonocardiaceae bacterium YIM PH 21723]
MNRKTSGNGSSPQGYARTNGWMCTRYRVSLCSPRRKAERPRGPVVHTRPRYPACWWGGPCMDAALIGRERELAVLAQSIARAERGQGRTLLLSGEAGIGKSRLAAHAVGMSRDRGFSVLTGQAAPLHAGLAYAPVVEALRRHLNSLSKADSAALLDGLPDLAGLVGERRTAADRTSVDPELERTLMFEAALRLVERITERAPTMLVMDDLHWSDRGTIELLHYLGRGTRARRLLLLCAYRSTEPGGALAELARTVRREQPGGELTIGPLSDDAVTELIKQLLGRQGPTKLVREVTGRARGVPLFVTALVAAGDLARQDPVGLPVIVRDIVLDRLYRLDDAARRLIEAIAVAGESGSVAVLRAAVGERAQPVEPVLRALVGDGLIIEELTGRTLTYRVAHPLYAEVAYAELTRGERQTLHAAIAHAIDQLDPQNTLALAPHYRDAGDLVDRRRATEVLAAAGHRALDVYDAQEAADYLGSAVDLARGTVDTGTLVGLLDELAIALQASGRLAEAAAVWEEACELGESLPKERQLWRLRFRALLEVERGNAAAAGPLIKAGAMSRGESGPLGMLVHWVAALQNSSLDEIRQVSAGMAALPDEPSPEIQTIRAFGRGNLAMLDGAYPVAAAEMRVALAGAERCGETMPFFSFAPYRIMAGLAVLDGRPDQALHHVRPGTGHPEFVFPGLSSFAHYMVSVVHYMLGDMEAALAEIEQSLREAVDSGQDWVVCQRLAWRATLYIERGEFDRAETDLTEARRLADRSHWSAAHALELTEAVLALHTGSPAEISTLEPPFRDLIPDGLRLHLAGRLAVIAGQPERVDEAITLMRATRTPLLETLAEHLDGLRTASAETVLAAAHRLDTMGLRLLAAQVRLEGAELSQEPLEEDVRRVLTVFTECGAAPWVRRARRLARMHHIPAQPARTTGTLSTREAEIVTLVGQGLTNAQIAARLYLSERTVETHLHNSYKKLRLGTRVALAQWAQSRVTDPG